MTSAWSTIRSIVVAEATVRSQKVSPQHANGRLEVRITKACSERPDKHREIMTPRLLQGYSANSCVKVWTCSAARSSWRSIGSGRSDVHCHERIIPSTGHSRRRYQTTHSAERRLSSTRQGWLGRPWVVGSASSAPERFVGGLQQLSTGVLPPALR